MRFARVEANYWQFERSIRAPGYQSDGNLLLGCVMIDQNSEKVASVMTDRYEIAAQLS